MTASTAADARDPHNEFSRRHIGPSEADSLAMLEVTGAASLDALCDVIVPESIRQRVATRMGVGMTEAEVLARLRSVASKNRILISLIGQGYHGTLLPSVIQRNILENPAWYTAYTPYQPEISQGRLEAMFNFQTLIAELTGLPVANASLLDEATAAAEAMGLAHRISKSDSSVFFVDHECHPQTLDVLRTRANSIGWTIVVGDPTRELGTGKVFGALLQYPGTSGAIRDDHAVIARLRQAGAAVAVAADPLALTVLKSPAELGADIAVGSTQRFGVPMGYGGPHAAYMAVREEYKRSLPGRLVGISIDARGESAYRLALQTREQHIRRENATSNICTAQVLLAVIASMYAIYHGPEGLIAIARRVAKLSSVLATGLRALGFRVVSDHFFDTISVDAGTATPIIHRRALAAGFNLRHLSSTRIGIALDETSTLTTVEAVWRVFSGDEARVMSGTLIAPADAIPAQLRRTGAFMTQRVFHAYRSETELLRYMRRLSDKDLALDRTMIPLGSCTMKLNATAQMVPITWPEFSNLHPFSPVDQAAGYMELFEDLQSRLCAITGYDAVSLQPNSGAQGEYAGLLAIRAYHRCRGQGHRDVCLIPSSAHGTNPASAQMAGLRVVVVGCDARGNVDLTDLRSKVALHGDTLAAIMVTYPSTHGVFEEGIQEICAIVHAAGGQVYLDGANLNAQIGLAQPGQYGADVSHFNLHKTFCIPHGGGGPGMGPIGVKAHLAPFLPGHIARGGAGAVAAAPHGSASILPISWAYLLLMGDEGLKRATQVALLASNYLVRRLERHYPVLYRGANGRVAHECIIDLRSIRAATGITVDDIAKRLIDFGFHAPTVSFPVAGTFMIEPTESESLGELDRFVAAMLAIREEIAAIERGAIAAEDSPLRHAPHTARDLVDERWQRAYSRREACFPEPALAATKYWCPVNRVDHGYGDRNLVCSCPPTESYADVS